MTTHPKQPPVTPNPENTGEKVANPDTEGALLGVEIGRLLQEPALQTLNKMAMDDDIKYGSPFFGYAINMALTGKLARTRSGTNLDGNVIRTDDIMNEFQNSRLTMQYRSLREFHEMFTGLANAHGVSSDELADDFDTPARIEKSIQFVANDIMAFAHNGDLVNADDGKHNNLSEFAKRLRMFEAIYVVSNHAHDPEYTAKMYDVLKANTVYPKQGEDRELETLSNRYALEIGKEETSATVLQSITARRPDIAQAIVDRASAKVILANSEGRMGQIRDHAPKLREQYLAAIAAIKGTDLNALYEKYDGVIERLKKLGATDKATDLHQEILDITSLDWEVLPVGQLRDIAEDIVEKASKSGNTPVTIDLNRLKILEGIRESWGADRAYYARGTLGTRKVVRDGDQESPDQYLLLILQELDRHGVVTAEHAIAESPIAGPHAMYVFRQDVSEGLAWREVMALSKLHARDLGARPVKHVRPSTNGDTGLIETMQVKAELLMSCTPEEFKIAEFNGERGIRLPKSVVTVGNNEAQS